MPDQGAPPNRLRVGVRVEEAERFFEARYANETTAVPPEFNARALTADTFAKVTASLSDEARGPKPNAEHIRIFEIVESTTDARWSIGDRLRAACMRYHEEQITAGHMAGLSPALWADLGSFGHPVPGTAMHTLMIRYSEWRKRRHPLLLDRIRYGPAHVEFALAVRRFDIAAAIFALRLNKRTQSSLIQRYSW